MLIVDQAVEEALFMNESFQKTFLRNSPDATVQGVLDSLIISDTGSDAKEHLADLFKDFPLQSLKVFLQKAIQMKNLNTDVFTAYASSLSSLKEEVFYELKIFKVDWSDTQAIGITFIEITSRRDALFRQIADTIRDKLLHTLSHELKTPLHGVITMSNLTLQTTKDPEAIFALDFCRKNALLLLSFINSILDYQTILAKTLELNVTRISLEDTMKEVISLFEIHRSQKGISLTVDIDERLSTYLYTDSERLSQALIILLNNSMKFTSTGKITVNIKPDPLHSREILFEVEDTGVGISPDRQKALFKPLEGLEAYKNNTQGAGFGLIIANQIAKLLGTSKQGEGIKCTSELGKGSTFSFSILNYCTNDQRRLSKEQDLSSFMEQMEDPDIEARIGQYSRCLPEPSKALELSRSISSSTLNPNDADEYYLLLKRQQSPVNRFSLAPMGSCDTTSPTNSLNVKRRKEGRTISILVTPPKESGGGRDFIKERSKKAVDK